MHMLLFLIAILTPVVRRSHLPYHGHTVTLSHATTSGNPQIPSPNILPPTRTISISQFGAIGDGKTDDSKCLIAALRYAATSGMRLQLENKTYLITQLIRLPEVTTPMVIAGKDGSTLLFAPPSPLNTAILIADASNVVLTSFKILGSGAGIHHAISVQHSTNIELDHLHIDNVRGPGTSAVAAIFLGNDDRVWITNSTITEVHGAPHETAFAIWNYYRLDSQHIYIARNHISDNAANIVLGMFDTYHSIVQDNYIDGSNICVEPCGNNGYAVLFYLVNYHGMSVSLAPKVMDEAIVGNRISNTAGSAIYLASVSSVRIATNTITDST